MKKINNKLYIPPGDEKEHMVTNTMIKGLKDGLSIDAKTEELLRENPSLQTAVQEQPKLAELLGQGYGIHTYSVDRHTAVLSHLETKGIITYDTRLRKVRHQIPFNQVQPKPY